MGYQSIEAETDLFLTFVVQNRIMNTTLIKAHFGTSSNCQNTIEVSMPYGGGECFYVMIDNYFQGAIVSSMNGWQPHIKTKILTGDDLGVILDLINETFPHEAQKKL